MCVSSRSSLVLFLTGTISSLVLAYKYQDINYLSYATVSLMQLSEWLMWIDVESRGKYETLNILGNYIGILSLFLQTSFMNIMRPSQIGNYMLIVHIICYSIMTYNYAKKHNLSKKVKSNKLSWGIMKANNSVFLTILVILFVISQTFVNVVHLKSMEFSFVNYFILFLSIKATTPLVKDFSSLWCYMGAICVIIYTFYKLIFM